MTGIIKVLMILTSQATMGPGGQPTGVWMDEVTTPYYAFTDAGAEVEIASIDGGEVPVDPRSLRADGKNVASAERFLHDPDAMRKLRNSKAVSDVSAKGYDIVFLPGGHGVMWDAANSQELGALVSDAWAGGEVVAAVCHGPAGLINAKDSDGKPLVAGRTLSAFTNSEESKAGLDKVVPFLLESRLSGLGANIVKGPDFQPYAVSDGNLVTGQNPASSEKVALLALEKARSLKAAPSGVK